MTTGIALPTPAAGQAVDEALVDAAVARYHEAGYVFLENVYDRAFIEGIQKAYFERFVGDDVDWEDVGFKVGTDRYMIGVPLVAPFDDPQLYAHPFLLAVLRKLLGPEAVLNSFGSVVSLPGSGIQHPHADHPPLFEDPAINKALPPFAVTVVIPLVDLTPDVGSTAMWPGTHKMAIETFADLNNTVRPELFVAPMGSVYLMDYEVYHAGMPNESARPRPIMYSIYSRPWFTDYVNYKKITPLVMSRKVYDGVAPEHKALFAQVRDFRG